MATIYTPLELVRAQYPAFDDVADATVSIFISKASDIIGNAATTWGNFFPYAVAALAGHYLELRARSLAAGSDDGTGGAGTLAGAPLSVSTDRLSVSYGDTAGQVASMGSQSDAIYASTAGGREYLMLRGRLAKIPLTV